MGYDWSASGGRESAAPVKKNSVSRSEKVRIPSSLGYPKMSSCSLSCTGCIPVVSMVFLSLFTCAPHPNTFLVFPGSLAQLPDWQIDQLMFVATNIGPMVSIKDLRVNTRGELTFGWHLFLTLVVQLAGHPPNHHIEI